MSKRPVDEGRDKVELVPVDDCLAGEIAMSGGLFSHVDGARNIFPLLAQTGDAVSFLRDTDPASKAFCISGRWLAFPLGLVACVFALRWKSPPGGTSKFQQGM